jgi:hypothetical protein
VRGVSFTVVRESNCPMGYLLVCEGELLLSVQLLYYRDDQSAEWPGGRLEFSVTG